MPFGNVLWSDTGAYHFLLVTIKPDATFCQPCCGGPRTGLVSVTFTAFPPLLLCWVSLVRMPGAVISVLLSLFPLYLLSQCFWLAGHWPSSGIRPLFILLVLFTMLFKSRNFGIRTFANRTVCPHVKLELRGPGQGSATD